MDILEQNELEAVESKIEAEATPEPAKPVEDELPEKYRGKSAAEIARIALEQEKFIGKQAQEVGEVRKLADQLLQVQLRAAPQQPQPAPENKLDDVDFFADPKAAVARAVAQHPAVLNANRAAMHLAQQESLRNLKEKHPDYTQIVSDPEFQEFIGKSRYRQQLFQQADRNYDFDAADEVLSLYKEIKGKKVEATSEQAKEVKERQEQSLRAASNPAIGGSSEPTGKKIYRRIDLINLRIKNPERYEALENEIMAAYREGRVR